MSPKSSEYPVSPEFIARDNITHYLKKRYPLFKNIHLKTTTDELKKIYDDQVLHNINTTNYLKLQEVDCNIDTKYNPYDKSPLHPIVLRGFCKQTKAFKTWTKDNLPSVFGDKKVEIEHYHCFLEFLCNEVNSVREYNMQEYLQKKDTEYLYFGETHLFKFDKPSIFQDIHNPRIPLCDETDEQVIFFGNKYAGSSTHIHIADQDYILNQIIGTKTMYFFDLHDNSHNNIGPCSPFNKYRKFLFDSNNFDAVNVNFINHDKLKIYKVTLHPGDSVIIPPWWWHNAVSNDFSLSITGKYDRLDKSFYYSIPTIGYYEFVLRCVKPEYCLKIAGAILEFFIDNLGLDVDPTYCATALFCEEYIIKIFSLSFYIFLITFMSILLRYTIFHEYKNIIHISFFMFVLILLDWCGICYIEFINWMLGIDNTK